MIEETNLDLCSAIVKLNDRVLELEEDIDRTNKLLTFAVYNMTDEQYSAFLKYEQELISESKDTTTSLSKESIELNKCTSAHKIK